MTIPIVDTVDAFCPHGRFRIEGRDVGPLAGSTFGVKDLIDIAGHVTGAGHPRWLETHAPAAQTAPCVRMLLDAGATMIGKTISDELAYSLQGENSHYGTPKNTNAPGRVPGGSSSGSAAAVAAGLCDFALGTDTGGSIRIPASYCGIFGIRTTHGLLSTEGVVPLMPSHDTIGWFARDADLFATIGEVLLPIEPHVGRPERLTRLLAATDAFAIADTETMNAIASVIAHVREVFDAHEEIAIAEPEGLEEWRSIFRTMSAAETWTIHGDWIEAEKPKFAAPIAERFAFAKTVSAPLAEAARQAREAVRARVGRVLKSDGVLCLPTAPGPAPRLDADAESVEAFRQRAQRLTCIAGLADLPQVSMPVAHTSDGLPVGLSLIGPIGSDRLLLELCRRVQNGVLSKSSLQRTEQDSRGDRCA
jgi:amidase